MTHKFLKAKHWQLFLFTFGIPLILILVGLFVLFSMVASIGGNSFFVYIMRFVPIILPIITIMGIICAGAVLGWFWSVAVGLQNKVPEGVKMNVKKFKIFFFISIVYMIISQFTEIQMSDLMTMMINGTEPSGGLTGGFVIVIVPLWLFSIFCTFYSLYFVAKTFKTVELQREVEFSDFAKEFFMIWLYPIGIWIIQPKLNKMVENEKLLPTMGLYNLFKFQKTFTEKFFLRMFQDFLPIGVPQKALKVIDFGCFLVVLFTFFTVWAYLSHVSLRYQRRRLQNYQPFKVKTQSLHKA